MADTVPKFVRAVSFAASELLLEIFRDMTAYYKLDLEGIWILLAIGHETMRPWILDPSLADQFIAVERVPDSVRGSVSRRMVAERTGLPRETVRRRIAELAELGFVTFDAKGRVRLSGARASSPAFQQVLMKMQTHVLKYQARVAALAGDGG